MPTLTEILIYHGAMSIEMVDSGIPTSPQEEEVAVRELVSRGVVTAAQVTAARAAQQGIPYVELLDFSIDQRAVAMVPATLARRHSVLPLALEGEYIYLGMSEPSNVFAIDDVRQVTRLTVKPVLAEPEDLRAAIDRYYRGDEEMENLREEFEDEGGSQALVPVGSGDLAEIVEDDAPIVRFVNLLISQAIRDRASDIHIEPAEKELRVRYRLDGVLHEMQRAPKNIQAGVISRLKVMSDIDISEKRRPQDGRLSVSHGGRKIDLRVATLPTVWGEKVVMRILDSSSTSLQLADLGMLDHNAEMFKKSYTKPYGMILVTGPTGSGKSTTLYTTLNAIARPEINVITVEDPVEFRIPGINQVQVNVKAGLTFANALRSILRSDPDVVLIGEIRDQETAQIAIEAALTGHMVLSTLHTNDAPSAITRLIEMDIEPFLVGSALDCIVAQRLARRLCDRCKEAYRASPAEIAYLSGSDDPALAERPIYRAVGCSTCSNTGYRGRIALHEVMPVAEEIERLAVARTSSTEIGRAAKANGMRTLREDGWLKVALGVTSMEEILRVVA